MGCIASQEKQKQVLPTNQPKQSKPEIHQQFKTECKICFMQYNATDRIPMSLPCFHTICSLCLNSLNTKECPFDHKKFANFGKNFQLLSVIERFGGKKVIPPIEDNQDKQSDDSIKKKYPVFLRKRSLNQGRRRQQPSIQAIPISSNAGHPSRSIRSIEEVDRNIQRQRPPNRIFRERIVDSLSLSPVRANYGSNPCASSHSFILLSYQSKCGTCRQMGRCWQCRMCRTKMCLLCNHTQLLADKCPNNHNTKWINSLSKCIKCSRNYQGKNCIQCSYTICDECSNLEYTKACPNRHQTKWVSYKDKCNKCKMNNRGFHCIKCSYHFCDLCNNTRFKQNMCPNKHQTLQRSIRSTCTKCGEIQLGFSCNACLYHICNNCH